jgi:hypothetical protein
MRAADLRVRVHPRRGIGPDMVGRVVTHADALLGSAGLDVEWDTCLSGDTCTPSDRQAPEAVVILTLDDVPGMDGNCGVALPGRIAGRGTVVVSVRCVDAIALSMIRLHARTHPLLMAWRSDDLVGAVIAHEIGHLLGLRHGRRGVMGAALDPADVLSLRTATCSFTSKEAAQMRRTLTLSRAAHTTIARHETR